MGGCIGTPLNGSSRNGDSSDGQTTVGRNQPLRPEKHRWNSDPPWLKKQLDAKREEFWDTQPAYDGRREIWDALKAAANALENNDVELAQAIIDGASILLPNGTLTDCYDELGTHYALPKYVILPPNNIRLGDDANYIEETKDKRLENRIPPGTNIHIKFRLSIGRDVKLVVSTTDTVSTIKERIYQEEGIEVDRQRWFFAGKEISNSRLRIEDAKIPKGFVVQVIINETPNFVLNPKSK